MRLESVHGKFRRYCRGYHRAEMKMKMLKDDVDVMLMVVEDDDGVVVVGWW